MAITYSSYLKLDSLLKLQTGSQPKINNDELLFVTIHQVCELWFKLLLNTLENARMYLNQDDLHLSIKAFQRCRMIIKTIVAQTDVISTLSPIAFNTYRSLLGGSSGLQSYQFREVECIFGYKRDNVLKAYPKDSHEYQQIQRRLQEESIPDALQSFLDKQGISTALHEKNPSDHDQLIQLYHSRQDIALLLDLLLDIDEGFQEWRYRHVKLVERVIGTKQGTGKTNGLTFLKATLFKPFFPALWEIRSKI